MTTKNYGVLRADWFIRKTTATVWKSLGNAPGVTNGLAVESVDLQSYGNTPGILDTSIKSIGGEVALKLNSLQLSNLALYVLGTSETAAAATGKTYSHGVALKPGETIVLPDSFVGTVAVLDNATALSGTQTVSIVGNTITHIGSADITDPEVTYNKLAEEGVGFYTDINAEYQLYGVSTDGFVHMFYRGKLLPGSMPLVTDNQFETDVKFKVMQDTSKAANATYGQYGYCKRAA
jgi:hypothetical protein